MEGGANVGGVVGSGGGITGTDGVEVYKDKGDDDGKL